MNIIRKKEILIPIICFILFIPCILQIRKTNTQYPQTQYQYIERGDSYALTSNLTLSIEKTQWVDKDTLETTYYTNCNNIETYGLFVTANITNTGKKKETFETGNLYIENSDYYSNGIDMDMYCIANNTMDMFLSLTPGESKQIILTYCISNTVCFNDKYWNNIKNAQYYIVFKRYPTKIHWNC